MRKRNGCPKLPSTILWQHNLHRKHKTGFIGQNRRFTKNITPGIAAGSMDIHTLWPLAQAELHDANGNFIDNALKEDNSIWLDLNLSFEELLECIVMGGYPDVLKRPTSARRENWCASYLQTLLQRGARDIAKIERLIELPALMNLLAHVLGV